MNINHLSIGMTAPDFTADSTFGMKNMHDYKGKWLVFFSHPGDFTPVCTTEFLAFTEAYPQFTHFNTDLLGLSIDSNPSHLAWVNEIQNITGKTIPFPIIADRIGEIASLYGMLAPEVSKYATVRNVYIIDPKQVIRAILIYPMTNGRNIWEILRLIIALQATDKYNVVTPANWEPGQPVLVSPPNNFDEMMLRKTDPESEGLHCRDWFWCYKQIPDENPIIRNR